MRLVAVLIRDIIATIIRLRAMYSITILITM